MGGEEQEISRSGWEHLTSSPWKMVSGDGSARAASGVVMVICSGVTLQLHNTKTFFNLINLHNYDIRDELVRCLYVARRSP